MTESKPAHAKRTCWAASLGNCSDKLSGEHVISAALFPGKTKISIKGFSWSGSEARDVGMSALTSKILCTHHNSILSPLDAEAGKAFNCFESIARDMSGGRHTRTFSTQRHKIDGPKFERWMLKTLINLYISRSMVGFDKVAPPENRLTRMAFGLEPIPDPSGFYMSGRRGQKIEMKPELQIAPLLDGENLLGAFFVFRGYTLVLWMATNALSASALKGSQWGEYADTEPVRHWRHIELKRGLLVSHIVSFVWPEYP